MEILRVPPYDVIFIEHYLVPIGSDDFVVKVIDMADLSVTETTYANPQTGVRLSSSVSGRHDNDYKIEVFANNSSDATNLVYEEFYEIIRPYSNPEDNGTTASEIAEYALKEEIARAVIDSVIPEGFYYEKKVLEVSGNGSDYVPVWDNVKKILAVYENNVLVEDRSYSVTPDKSAIIESSSDLIDRMEGAPIIIPAGQSDTIDTTFIYRGFARGWDYRFVIEHGYETVPSDIRRATEMLIHDIDCGKLDYYKRYISSYNTDQFKIQFDKGLFEGTGNIIVDKILSKYAKSIKKIGVL
jgi:hypothetical protein